MDVKLQRQIGLEMAVAAGATKTQAAIEDKSSCYENILKAAVEEKGLEFVTEKVLESDPEWASQMLQHIPDLGAHRDALLNKAKESPASALHALRFVADLGNHQQSLVAMAGRDATSLGNISAINFKCDGPVICKFTMYWTNAGEPQPQTGYPNSSDWHWSGKLPEPQSQTIACHNFTLVNAPLEAGDEVWIYVSVEGGKDPISPLRFTFDPTTVNCANFLLSGPGDSNTLAYSSMSVAAPMVTVSISSDGVASFSPDVVNVYRSSQTGVQWQMKTPAYEFTGIDIQGPDTQDFGAPTFNADNTVMTVTDTVADLDPFTYTIYWKNTQTGQTGKFDPGIKNKD